MKLNTLKNHITLTPLVPIQRSVLHEAVDADNQEYYDTIKTHYDNELLDIVKRGDDLAMGHGDTFIQKSDIGNVFVKWVENNDAIFLLGISSRHGSIKRGDVKDVINWMNLLADKIEDGKVLYTSPNKLSDKLLKKVEKILKDRDISFNKEEFPSHMSGWNNIILRRVPPVQPVLEQRLEQRLYNILSEDIQTTWDKHLKNKIQQEQPNQTQEWLDNFLKGLLRAEKYINELGENPDKIINRYIKKNLPKLAEVPEGHIHDRIYTDLTRVSDERLPPDKRKELEINRAVTIIKKTLRYNDEDAQKLATEIINSGNNVLDVIGNMSTDTGDHKELLDSAGKYRLFKITKWVTDGTEEKHINTHKPAPVHVDMKGTQWCVRFKDYFYCDRYQGGPFYIIEKMGKPYILYYNGDDSELRLATKNMSIDYNDKNLIKLLLGYKNILNNAAESGNPEVVKLILKKTGAKPDDETLNLAARSGNPEVVKLLLNLVIGNEQTLNYAAESGNPEVVKLILDAGIEPDILMLDYAAGSGNPEVVKLILDAGIKPDDKTLNYAAESGNIEVVKLVLDAGAKPAMWTLDYATRSGNPEVVKLVLALGAKLNDETLSNTVKSGNPEIIKLFLDPEIIKLFLDNAGVDRPFLGNILKFAVEYGNPEAVRLIKVKINELSKEADEYWG